MKFSAAAMAVVVLVASPLSASARGFDFNISDDSLRATYFASATPAIPMSNAGFDAGLLYVEEDNFDALVAHLGVGVSGDTGAQRANVIAGLGARLSAIDVESVNGVAISIGASVNFRLPEYQRLGAGAEIYFAPEVSSFADIDEYFEFTVSIDYQLLRDAFAYVAYRNLKIDVDQAGEATIDNGVVLGFRVRY